MSAVNKVNFLLQAASIFPPNGHANQLLKSHYLSTSREVAQKELELPKKEFGETRMCQKCSSIWLDGNLKLHIKSKKLRRPKQKKLVTRAEAGDVLTRQQKSKAKWLKKNSLSRVEITCLLCKHKTKLHLDKPKVSKDSTPLPSAPPSTQETLDSSSSSSLRKPTKKKKKDKFAGLNPSAFNQASTSSSNSSNPSAVISNKLTPCTSSSNTSQNPAKSSSKSSKKLKKSDNKILPLSNSIKKAKNKKGNVQNPPKQVSKTQQKNTLLQLAQLLKSGASLSNKKPNPLENLLR